MNAVSSRTRSNKFVAQVAHVCRLRRGPSASSIRSGTCGTCEELCVQASSLHTAWTCSRSARIWPEGNKHQQGRHDCHQATLKAPERLWAHVSCRVLDRTCAACCTEASLTPSPGAEWLSRMGTALCILCRQCAVMHLPQTASTKTKWHSTAGPAGPLKLQCSSLVLPQLKPQQLTHGTKWDWQPNSHRRIWSAPSQMPPSSPSTPRVLQCA